MTRNMDEIAPDDRTAIFTSVTCEKYSEPKDFADLDGATPHYADTASGSGVGTRQASCSGWWQEAGRKIKMVVEYKVTRFEPQKVPWVPWR
jgi:hypothetical protein